jgi:hypothetical protein
MCDFPFVVLKNYPVETIQPARCKMIVQCLPCRLTRGPADNGDTLCHGVNPIMQYA